MYFGNKNTSQHFFGAKPSYSPTFGSKHIRTK